MKNIITNPSSDKLFVISDLTDANSANVQHNIKFSLKYYLGNSS